MTSWSELRRDGREADATGRESWVAQCLCGSDAPVVMASDYVSALPDMIRPWIAARTVTLGTDGFGRSDTRAALRAYFGVDAAGVAGAARKLVR